MSTDGHMPPMCGFFGISQKREFLNVPQKTQATSGESRFSLDVSHAVCANVFRF